MSWSFLSLYPSQLWGEPLDLPVGLGHVSLDEEGRDLLRQLARVAWHSCNACYGTGFEDYRNKARMPEAKRIRDCKSCDGLGAVQHRALEKKRAGRL